MDLTSYIANVSMSMAQTSLMNSVGTAMLSKTISAAETEGANMVNMLNSADLPPAGAKGHLLNIRV